jgi:hypothetical protein
MFMMMWKHHTSKKLIRISLASFARGSTANRLPTYVVPVYILLYKGRFCQCKSAFCFVCHFNQAGGDKKI